MCIQAIFDGSATDLVRVWDKDPEANSCLGSGIYSYVTDESAFWTITCAGTVVAFELNVGPVLLTRLCK